LQQVSLKHVNVMGYFMFDALWKQSCGRLEKIT
jgi:hypothetical protein